MLSGVIRSRPWTIIVAWIIIVAILSQYAAQINNVVKTETESFLPERVESVRAEKELSKLYNASGAEKRAEPEYLILVHGVDVSLDSYYKLKGPGRYDQLKEQAQGDIFSWIDIVDSVRENISQGYMKGVNQTVQAVKGVVMLNAGYNHSLYAAEMLTKAVAGADMAYTGLLKNMSLLAGNISGLKGFSSLVCSACNKFLPLEMKTYFDVVRAEALLEEYTNAYENGSLTPADVTVVVNMSNLTAYGVEPVTPDLVGAVFNFTLMSGGPQAFSNSLAAQLAAALVEQAVGDSMNSTQFQQVYPALTASAKVWYNFVVQRPDDRLIITQAPDPFQGQLLLLQNLSDSLPALKPEAAAKTAWEVYNATGGDIGLLLLIANTTAQLGCDPNMTGEAVATAITVLLSSQGIPQQMAQELAGQLVETGTVNRSLVLNIALELFSQKAAEKGENVSTLVPHLKELITSLDPAGQGNLTSGPLLNASAAYLVGVEAGAIQGPPEAFVKPLAEQSPGLEEAVFRVYVMIVQYKQGPDAVPLLGALWDSGLLGSDNETLLSQIPQLLAPMTAKKANISNETALEIVKAAVEVYKGNITLEQAVDSLTNQTLEEVFPEVVDEIKGLLVEKNLTGFLISYNPQAATTEEKVNLTKHLKSLVKDSLERAGYGSAEVLAGGNGYMSWEMRQAALKDVQKSDRMSMVFVLIMMAIVLESIAAVFLPFIGIGFGLVTSLAIAYFLAKAGVIDVTTHSRTIMYTTGLGLGIDYAVYVSRRFREVAAEGLPSREAAARAFSLSWKPVIAGATTAMIGFGSMLIARDFPFLTSIGANVPLTIFMVMIASITFIPALLAYVGETRWFWWPRHPVETRKKARPATGGRLSVIARKPLPFLLLVLILGGLSAYVVASYQGSYDITLNLPHNTESYRAVQAINTYYDPGVLYPTYIIASSPDTAKEVSAKIQNLSCVSKTVVEENLQGRVVYAYMSVNPLSAEGVKCAEEIRGIAHSIDPGSLVGGMSSVNLDLRNEINHVFYHKVYPVAITLMFLTILAAYGGLAVALAAVFSVVLAAYMGSAATILYYEHVKNLEVLWYLPVIVFTAILGVGMDYNSFYIARAREECEKECSRDAVARSLRLGTPTVIGLSIIMASAYVGLAVTSTPGLASMGAALMLGVLAAGVNASLLLTPPLVALLGQASWWPRRAGRKG